MRITIDELVFASSTIHMENCNPDDYQVIGHVIHANFSHCHSDIQEHNDIITVVSFSLASFLTGFCIKVEPTAEIRPTRSLSKSSTKKCPLS